jgi:hypothetical protein
MSDTNKNVVRRLFDEVWNKGHLPVADQLFAQNYSSESKMNPALPSSCRGVPRVNEM